MEFVATESGFEDGMGGASTAAGTADYHYVLFGQQTDDQHQNVAAFTLSSMTRFTARRIVSRELVLQERGTEEDLADYSPHEEAGARTRQGVVVAIIASRAQGRWL